MAVRRVRLLVLLSLALAGCATTADTPVPGLLGQDHPLVGRIWDVGSRRVLDRRELVARLARARFVLLGEKHDNLEHHRLQAWTVHALLEAGRRPAVGFEMLSLDQAPALARYLQQRPRDAAGLGDAVDWKATGWPDWPIYQPIADAALAAGVPIIAANLSTSATQGVRQRGTAALDPAFVSRVGLDRPLDEAIRQAMGEEIRDSHCGYAPAAMLGPMIVVQRARDAQMADALAAGSTRDGAVLIAGAGHARTDWAVPVYLHHRVPGAVVASVAFVEVRRGRTEPEAYTAEYGGRVPFDYVWFTPRVDDTDPCEQFKRSLERLRERRP